MKHGFQLVAFDLDGTVLADGEGISNATLRAMNMLRNQGTAIALATGRSMNMIPRSIKSLPFLRYIICANGAVIFDCESEEVIFSADICREKIFKILEKGKKAGAGFSVDMNYTTYIDVRYYLYFLREIGTKLYKYVKKKKRAKNDFHFSLSLNLSRLISRNHGKILKINCLYKNEIICREQLSELLFVQDIEPVIVMGVTIEITAKGATKGAALKIIGERLGIGKDHILAFGDSGNDLSMRESAGTFVAMGNATNDVKEIADHITDTVSEEGVARAISTILRNGGL